MSAAILLPIVMAVAPAMAYTANEAFLIQSLSFESAAALAATKRVYDAKLSAARQTIIARDGQLKVLQARAAASGREATAARAEAQALEAQLTAEKAAYNDALAAKDAEFAKERAALTEAATDILKTPEGAKALALYLSDAPDAAPTGRMILKRAIAKRTAADARATARLTLNARNQGKNLSTDDAIADWEAVVAADSGRHWDWVELSQLYREANRLTDAAHAATRASEAAGSDRDRSIALNELGDTLLLQNDLSGAIERYQRGLDIAERLAKLDPSSAQAQRDVSVSLEKIGDVLVQRQDLAGAIERYQRSLDIAERLAKLDPSSAQAQRDVSVILSKIGDVLVQRQDLAGAIERYQRSLDIAERLAKLDPSSAQAQRDVSVILSKIGDVLVQRQDLAGAIERYQRSLDIAERLAKLDPSSAQAQRDVSVSLIKIGDLLVQRQDLAGAIERYQRSLDVRERLAKLDASSARAQRDVLITLNRLAFHGAPGISWRRALRQLEAMEKQSMLAPSDAEMIAFVKRQAAAEAAAGK